MKYLSYKSIPKIAIKHRVFFIFYILILVGLYFITQPFQSRVRIHVDVPQKIFLKIFWGQDSLKFRSGNSNGQLFSKHTNFRTIRAGNLYRIRYMRIDPLQRKGKVTIKKIEIRQPGFESIIFQTKNDFKAFIPIHHIENLKIQPDSLEITSSGNDPHMIAKLEPNFTLKRLFKYLLSFLFNALLLAGIIYGFYRWIALIGSAMEVGWPQKIFLATMISILIIRILFVVTYPLNSAGDGHSYYRMITGWHSSLAFAGGYPFVFGLLKPIFASLKSLNADFFFPRYLLLVVQHLVDLSLLAFLFYVIDKVFSSSVACLSLLFYGLNPFIIGSISTTRPEWFQAILFAASLGMAYLGYLSIHIKKKAIYYISASLIFCLAFYVKFNVLPLCLAFLFFIFLDRSEYRTKLKILAGIAISCAVFYTLFVFVYHKPSTGASTLTHARSWILMDRAHKFFSDRNLSIENGIHTKRFKVLTWYLKKHGNLSGAHPPSVYRHVDAIPAHVRKIYQNKYGYLLNADEKELDQIIRENPSIKNYLGNQLLISYYIGTQESNALGTKVFFEAVRAEPVNYLKSVWIGFLDSFLIFRKTNNFPLNQKIGGRDLNRPKAIDFEAHLIKKLNFGFSLIHTRSSRSIDYENPILWLPGVSFFSVLSHVFNYWPPFAWLSCFSVTTGCLFARFKQGKWSRHTFTPVVITGMVLFFIFWSNMIHRFRESKELILILPYWCIFSGLFLRHAYNFIKPGKRLRLNSS